jgi:hypothetical protein
MVGYKKIGKTVSIQTASTIAYHWIAVEEALKEGIVLQVFDKEDRALPETIFNLQKQVLPGAWEIPINRIPIDQTNNNHSLTDEKNPHVLCLTRSYKQADMKCIDLHRQSWEKINTACQRSLGRHTSEHEGLNQKERDQRVEARTIELVAELKESYLTMLQHPLQVIGTGGSNKKSGATAENLASARLIRHI